jgi:hypothetical protein
MEDFLVRGFELELYSDYELEYIHWYLAEIIYNGITRSLNCFQEINSKTKKGDLDENVDKFEKWRYLQHEIFSNLIA